MGICAHSQQIECTLALQAITCFLCHQWTYTDDTNYHTEVKSMEKKFLKAFSQLKTSESQSELDWSVRLHKFWQVISTFLHPSGATRIKFAADAFNFICGILQTKQTNCRKYVSLPMESHILSICKFCGAMKKDWWDMHSSCLCFVARLWTENGNLKMMEQENSPALSMLTLCCDNFLHHLPA